MKRITLKDVANQAGVATGTVSMVLNNSPLVADATRAHVQQVIRDLGYVYHRAAANLRKKNSQMVAMSICDIVNPYYADVTAGIQSALDAQSRALVLGNCAESVERQLRFFETLPEYNFEGLILIPAAGTPKAHLNRILEWRIPLVQVSRFVPGVNTDYVGNDNRLTTVLAVQHLLALGHKNIGYIGLNRLISAGRDRYAGFRSALAGNDYALSGQHVVECQASREAGVRAIKTLYESSQPPTAVVCFDDDLAFGAMLGLRQLGLEPGPDCSVVGIDDVSEAALWQPAMTTVAVSRYSIGEIAGQLLNERIAHPNSPRQRVILKPELIARESSCAPPKSKSRRKFIAGTKRMRQG